jgi:putative endonuclease
MAPGGQRGASGSPPNKRAIGKLGEDAVAQSLESLGYSVLHRNYRIGRYGEIDIIAKNGSIICFVEVKSRSSDRFGTPAEAVSWEKRQTIIAIASCYLATRRDPGAHARFDVAEVFFCYSEDGAPAVRTINYIEDAFQA